MPERAAGSEHKDDIAHTAELPEDVLAWLGWLESQRRVAAPTLLARRRDLERLLQLSAPLLLPQLTTHDIRRCAGRLHAQGLGSRSIARALSSWRGFYHWMGRYRGLEHNPVENVRAPKAPSRLPKALSPDQAAALLDMPATEPLELRDRAMFELFYSSGLRLAELTGLDVEAGLDRADAMVTVLGKRGKTRKVPVGSAALAALDAWLAERPNWAAEDERALFVTRTGRRMSSSAVRSRLTRWAQQCGLGVHVHPHMLRHSFASHMLQSSGDLRAVQELLGHTSIRSTQVYTHLDFQHLAKVYDAAHPRAKRR